MGKIIAFQPREKATQRIETPVGGSAEILFFTGVRYMRMDDSFFVAADAPDTRGGDSNGGKKRKRRARG